MTEIGDQWKQYHSWSRSRQKMFTTCPRQFCYQNIYSHDQKYGGELPSLKRMKNKGLRNNFKYIQGELVHKAIQNAFGQISRDREIEKEEAKTVSINYLSRRFDEIKNDPEHHIIEAMNGKTYEVADFEEIKANGLKNISIFYDEFYDFFKDLEIVTLDGKVQEFQIGEFRYWLVPDLITKSSSGKVFITDWKTNSDYEDAADPYQMKTYIYWAVKKGLSELENIKAEFSFLDTGESVDFSTTQDGLDEFEKELDQNANDLFSKLISMKNIEDFARNPNPDHCVECIFKAYCENNPD